MRNLVFSGIAILVAIAFGFLAQHWLMAPDVEFPAANANLVSEVSVQAPSIDAQSGDVNSEALPDELVTDGKLSEPALDPSQWVDHPEMRVFEEQFAYESIDPVWAARADNYISTALSASGLALAGIQYQCRSTLCRAMLTYAAPIETPEDLERLRPNLSRFFEAGMAGLSGKEAQRDLIVAVKARGLLDVQGREYANIVYFFRKRPPTPAWMRSAIADARDREQEAGDGDTDDDLLPAGTLIRTVSP